MPEIRLAQAGRLYSISSLWMRDRQLIKLMLALHDDTSMDGF